MRHRVAGRSLSRPTGHRWALFRNLVTELLDHERIVTTMAKAKESRGLAEHIITLGKRGDLHARRQALAFVYSEKVVRKVFSELAERYRNRPGGYTRLVRLGPRPGDGAPQMLVELVGNNLPAP